MCGKSESFYFYVKVCKENQIYFFSSPSLDYWIQLLDFLALSDSIKSCYKGYFKVVV